MDQADCVHSTPPSNTSDKPPGPSRRHILAGLAVLPAALPATAAGQDPVYAAIERFNAVSVEYTATVDRWANLEPDHPDYVDRKDENSDACAAFFDEMEILFKVQPTTVAGVAKGIIGYRTKT